MSGPVCRVLPGLLRGFIRLTGLPGAAGFVLEPRDEARLSGGLPLSGGHVRQVAHLSHLRRLAATGNAVHARTWLLAERWHSVRCRLRRARRLSCRYRPIDGDGCFARCWWTRCYRTDCCWTPVQTETLINLIVLFKFHRFLLIWNGLDWSLIL